MAPPWKLEKAATDLLKTMATATPQGRAVAGLAGAVAGAHARSKNARPWNSDNTFRGRINGEAAAEKVAQFMKAEQERNKKLYEKEEVRLGGGSLLLPKLAEIVKVYPGIGMTKDDVSKLRDRLEDPKGWNSHGEGVFEFGRWRVEVSAVPVATTGALPVSSTFSDSANSSTTSAAEREESRKLSANAEVGGHEGGWKGSLGYEQSRTDRTGHSATDGQGTGAAHTYARESEVQRVSLVLQVEDKNTGVRTVVALDDPPIEVLHNVNRSPRAQSGP